MNRGDCKQWLLTPIALSSLLGALLLAPPDLGASSAVRTGKGGRAVAVSMGMSARIVEHISLEVQETKLNEMGRALNNKGPPMAPPHMKLFVFETTLSARVLHYDGNVDINVFADSDRHEEPLIHLKQSSYWRPIKPSIITNIAVAKTGIKQLPLTFSIAAPTYEKAALIAQSLKFGVQKSIS